MKKTMQRIGIAGLLFAGVTLLGCVRPKQTTLYWIPDHQNYNGHTIIRAALSDTNGVYEIGLRSDGVMVWRKAP